MLSSEQVERARTVPIGDVIDARGIRLRGRVERTGPCPICGGNDRFAVNVKKAIFNCRGCNKGGDVIALVQHLDGVDFREAVAVLAGERVSEPRQPIIIRPKPDAEAYKRQQRNKARVLFRRSVPSAGTVVENYLRGRGIAIPLPGTVRYLDGQHPAMLVPYGVPHEIEPGVLETGAVTAVHLTLLKPDGSGKADTKPNKLTVASPAGMPMVLAPMNDLLGLAITEGIEDALSVHQATGLGAWAAGGWSNLPKLIAAIADAATECVTVFADADDAGQRGARELAEALVARGIEVFVRGLA
jgi:phage/plasmid primase-like uncharacterized protein